MNEYNTPLLPDNSSAAVTAPAPEGELHVVLRQKIRCVFLLAACVGFLYALFFSQTHSRGLNVLAFSVAWVLCLQIAYGMLHIQNLRRDGFYLFGVFALGFSVFLSSNNFVQFVSCIGILILMFLILAGGFTNCSVWSFGQYFKGFFLLLFAVLSKIPEPILFVYKHRKRDDHNGKQILIGFLIAVPLCIAAVSILASADWVFGHMIDSIFHKHKGLSEFWTSTLLYVLYFLFGFFAFFCTLSAQTDKPTLPREKKAKQSKPLIAVVFTGCLSLVYLLFCFVQIAFLFFGKGDALPNNYTYAEYAREGFFQLLFVSGANMLLVMCCTRRFPINRSLKILLTVISGCTYIMILSSAWRICLYVQTYGLTFLRILVLWFLTVLVVFMTAVIVYVHGKNFSMPRFFLTVGLIMWLVFALARVDRIAARYNFERFGDTSNEAAANAIYDLSMDAVPVMIQYDYQGLYSSEWEGYLGSSVPRAYERSGWRSFNLSLWEAYMATEEYHGK